MLTKTGHQTMIREATDKDTETLDMLFQRVRRDTFTTRPPKIFKRGDFARSTEGELVLVAVEEDQIVGFISVFLPSFIHNLFIDKPFQGKRIGSRLMRAAESTLIYPTSLKIAHDNYGVAKFYKKHGYQEISFHGSDEDPYFLYRKEISDGKF